jgi:hypothetical protein
VVSKKAKNCDSQRRATAGLRLWFDLFFGNSSKAISQSPNGGGWRWGFVFSVPVNSMFKVAKLARLAILTRPLKNRLFLCKAAKVAKMAKSCAKSIRKHNNREDG